MNGVVYLIHGLASSCSSDSIGNIRRALRKQGFRTTCINYNWSKGISKNIREVSRKLPKNARNVFGHSNGGIIANALSRVRPGLRVMTYGAPIVPDYSKRILSVEGEDDPLMSVSPGTDLTIPGKHAITKEVAEKLAKQAVLYFS